MLLLCYAEVRRIFKCGLCPCTGGYICMGSPRGAAGQAMHGEGGHLQLRRHAVGAFSGGGAPRPPPQTPQVRTLISTDTKRFQDIPAPLAQTDNSAGTARPAAVIRFFCEGVHREKL